MSARPNFKLRRLAARNLILYVLDLAAAIGGWIVGFGLTVHNWPALIAICVGLRWVFSVLATAFLYANAAEDTKVDPRDYFAAKAMLALIVEPVTGSQSTIQYLTEAAPGDAEVKGLRIARAAYTMADAMLKARSA